jgi:hypothetical protein
VEKFNGKYPTGGPKEYFPINVNFSEMDFKALK